MTLDQYNIVWDTQSRNSSESMPCGGYDLGLNVWTENGEILFYIDRSGSFDENNQMLKLGRVRLRFEPNPFAPGGTFRQELHLRQGFVRISGSSAVAGKATVDIWAEVDRPAVHVEISSDRPTVLTASYESWRTSERDIPADPPANRHPCMSYYGYPGKVSTKPDVIEYAEDEVIFYHQNRNDCLLIDKLIEQQGLEPVRDRIPNLQKDFIFGGMMSGKDMNAGARSAGSYLDTPFEAWNLKSVMAAKAHRVDLHFHAGVKSAEQWRRELAVSPSPGTPGEGRGGRGGGTSADLTKSTPTLTPLTLPRSTRGGDKTMRLATEKWWNEYWNRSHIHINPDQPDASNPAWQVGRNYQLFRYQLGCNARGEYPTKFNGGLFTFDPNFVPEIRDIGHQTPDYRNWGGGSFTAQNQRLLYWPMLKSGDFDMMSPQFEFYRRALSAAEARTELYWGHGGCSFTEQLENSGLPIGWGWGWIDGVDPRHRRTPMFDPTEQVGPWIRYEYSTQLEFALMIVRYHEYCGADISAYVPFIQSSLRFYDEHYQYRHNINTTRKLDANGKLVIFPSTALETYKDATNPTDAIAGLMALVDAMLELSAEYLSAEDREYFKGLRGRIPPFQFREIEGHKTISPAQSWSDIINVEMPQLYPVFPYDLYRIDQPEIQIAIDTWRYGIDTPQQRGYVSWHQDNIFCARMGLSQEAAALSIKKLADAKCRFPTFWGGGHDWTPDHNWGGSGMIGLQEMLMQTFGKRILLLPAWPSEWDVDFKLHAPLATVVEASVRGGKIVQLKVTPESRAADVVVTGA